MFKATIKYILHSLFFHWCMYLLYGLEHTFYTCTTNWYIDIRSFIANTYIFCTYYIYAILVENVVSKFMCANTRVLLITHLFSFISPPLNKNNKGRYRYVFYDYYYCYTGCQEKSTDSHETDSSYNGVGNCNGNGNICSGGGGSKNCVYRNGNNCSSNSSNSCSPLLETTADVVVAYNGVGAGAGAGCGGAVVDDWQLVQADFVDVPPGSDTAIRCVVQPPPDMLATHVCVEVGLVKSSAATATDAADKSEIPTIVVCSVDVEPCRQQQQQQQPVPATTTTTDKCSAVCEDDHVDDDVLDRISQDLDYLLNRKTVAAMMDSSTGADPADCYNGCDRNLKKQQQQQDANADMMVQKRTKL